MTNSAKRPTGRTYAVLSDEQGAELGRRALELLAHLFTPRLQNGKRIGIILDDASYDQVRGRGPGNRGVVTDLNTGDQYKIIGAACGLAGCVCDAIAIRMS